MVDIRNLILCSYHYLYINLKIFEDKSFHGFHRFLNNHKKFNLDFFAIIEILSSACLNCVMYLHVVLYSGYY